MLKKIVSTFSLLIALLMPSLVKADTLYTTVTNLSTATNGCSIRLSSSTVSSDGYTVVAIYGVTCPNISYNTSVKATIYKGTNCTVVSNQPTTSPYSLEGTCASFNLYIGTGGYLYTTVTNGTTATNGCVVKYLDAWGISPTTHIEKRLVTCPNPSLNFSYSTKVSTTSCELVPLVYTGGPKLRIDGTCDKFNAYLN